MTSPPFRPSPPSTVERYAEGGRWTLVFVRDLHHPPEVVWRALVEPARLRAWAPFVPAHRLDTTGEVTLTMIDGDREGPATGDVRRAEPPTTLEYVWAEDVLRWDLTPTDGGTRLTLRHTVASEDWLPRVTAGWHLCLDVAERFLDGRPVGAIVGAAAKEHGWEALERAYAEQLEPEPAGSVEDLNAP